jgi:hypothetical protein
VDACQTNYDKDPQASIFSGPAAIKVLDGPIEDYLILYFHILEFKTTFGAYLETEK